MNKKVLAVSISIIGLLMLIGTIIYQANSQNQAVFMVPIGLFLTLGGAGYLIKLGQKDQ